MTPPQATPDSDSRPQSCYWSRLDTAQAFADFSDPFHPPCSQRHYAQRHGIPRSTLGHWLRRDYPDHLDKAFVSFFRCPAGLAFLRRLLLALLLVFHHKNACGLRCIGLFLELVELHHFVASSYGALHTLDAQLQDDLILFGQQERQRLAAGMTAKDIAVCADENFHGPHVCLVGIEPLSDFILVETYRDRRDGVTWAAAIAAGADGLPVHVVLLTSDQATGLIHCAEEQLRVAHQPDLFHLQRDLSRPVLLPLARPTRQAAKVFEKARQATQRLDDAERRQPGSVGLDGVLESVREELQAKQKLEQAREKLEQAMRPIREVSSLYHPFDRETGRPVTAEQMQARLSESVQRLQKVVEEAGLSERAEQAVQRARGWVVLLVGCLAWFWAKTRARMEALNLGEAARRLSQECLLAGRYWEQASQREKDPAQRKRLQELAHRLQEQAWAGGGALAALSEEEREEVQRAAQECVGLFCRSSSCVEGRNGRLSLFHHGQARLSEKRLKALTAVHNYVVRREDGTTAAERFFGQKQRDAFTWLLQRMPDLPHPAAKRRHPASEEGSHAA
jgi:hypothetical protein